MLLETDVDEILKTIKELKDDCAVEYDNISNSILNNEGITFLKMSLRIVIW